MTYESFDGPLTPTERRYFTLLGARAAVAIGAVLAGVVVLTRDTWEIPAVGFIAWVLLIGGAFGMTRTAFRTGEQFFAWLVLWTAALPVLAVIAVIAIALFGDAVLLLPWGGDKD